MKTMEDVDKILRILNERTPNYLFQWNPHFDPQLGEEYATANKEYVIYYDTKNEKTMPVDFRISFTAKINEVIQYLKWQKYYGKINNSYLQIIIDELSEVIKTYELIKLRGKEFQFQATASISLYENNNFIYYKIENLPEYFFADVAESSQLRYDFTIQLIEGLKNLLNIEKKVELEENNLPSAEHDELTAASFKGFHKLEMNISVSEIALLYRLLDEQKIFKYKYKTEIYRYISSTLKSLNQDNISEASIKNKFLSPDPTAIKNLEIILSNLKQDLKKIK